MAAFSSVAEAQNFHPPAQGQANRQRADDVLEMAADIVQGIAPPPDPVTTDYEDRVGRAERLVFAYLWDTGGYKGGVRTIVGTSANYAAKDSAVFDLIASVLGDYVAIQAASTIRIVETRRS